MTSKQFPLIMGHRGFLAKYPENTLLSFQKAIELGADQLETDIHLSKDGHIIVCHDKNTKRMGKRNALINDMTLAEIKELKLPKNQKMPELWEVCELLKGNNVILSVEIKDPKVVDKFTEFLRTSPVKSQIFLSSFIPESLKIMKDRFPELEAGLIFSNLHGKVQEAIDQVKELGFEYINLEKSNLNQEIVDKVHVMGLKINGWIPNNKKEMKWMVEMGIDVITVNKLDKMLKFKEEWIKQK